MDSDGESETVRRWLQESSLPQILLWEKGLQWEKETQWLQGGVLQERPATDRGRGPSIMPSPPPRQTCTHLPACETNYKFFKNKTYWVFLFCFSSAQMPQWQEATSKPGAVWGRVYQSCKGHKYISHIESVFKILHFCDAERTFVIIQNVIAG